MDRSFIEQVRSFNRAVTLRAGALNDSYLGRGRPLAHARFLFQIESTGSDLRSLRESLGLDSGYASRLIKSLQVDGLIAVANDRSDRRRRMVTLTAAGRMEREAYDSLSDSLAITLLGVLTGSQQDRLLRAMAEVEHLISAASAVIASEPEDSPDAQACLASYFEELGGRFEGGFDPDERGYKGQSQSTSNAFIVARLDGRPVGCGALKSLDASTAEIKRMWVAPDARGHGIARRLLESLENLAQQAGMERIVLDTNRSLDEAQSFYRKAGYREIERYNDNPYAHFWFAKELG